MYSFYNQIQLWESIIKTVVIAVNENHYYEFLSKT